MKGIKFERVERIKQLPNQVSLPERGTTKAAGYDFYNPEEVTIEPKQIKIVKTGIKSIFPDDIQLKLYNRSSNPKKKGLILANGVGIVDADYYNNPDNEGEIGFMFMNITDEPVTLLEGEKLGQGIFEKYYITEDDNVETIRTGGWGSTGK